VSELLKDHVTLELEGIDRMYLNAYVPKWQCPEGAAWFFRYHRQQKFASSALMDPISKAFVAAIEEFALAEQVPLITFQKGQRKDDIAAAMRNRFEKEEGVLFIGKAQEKAPVFRTEKRTDPRTGSKYPWIVRSRAMVNFYYFYIIDCDFGPLDNGILSCDNVKRVQKISDQLDAAKIDTVFRKWLRRLPHPFTASDRKATGTTCRSCRRSSR